MKICFYSSDEKALTYEDISSQGASGTLSSMVFVAKGLAELGFNITVLGNFKEAISVENLNYHCIKEIESLDTYSSNFDVFVFVGHCGAQITNRLSSPKVFYWAHNWIEPKFYDPLLGNNIIDGVIFVSHFHKAHYQFKSLAYHKLKYKFQKKLYVIQNPIDLSLLEPYRKTLPRRTSDSMQFAFVGYPSVNKGFDKVCDLIENINKYSGIRVKLNVFGAGDLYSIYSAGKVDGLFEGISKIQNDVILHGSLGRCKLYREVSSCDAIISGLNSSETFCVSLLEASYMSVPVISSKYGGQIEFLEHKKNAYLLQYGEANNLDCVNSIINFIRNYGEMANKKSLNGQDYSICTIAEKWSDLLVHNKNCQSTAKKIQAYISLCQLIFKKRK